MKLFKYVLCVCGLCGLAALSGAASSQESDLFEPTQGLKPASAPLDDRFNLDAPRPSNALPPEANQDRRRLDQFTLPKARDLFSDDDLRGEFHKPYIPPTPTPSTMMRPQTRARTVYETVYDPIPQEEIQENKKYQAAIKQLKEATDEDKKKAAATAIEDTLTSQFERDLKRREEELEKVEAKVKALREQLDKRKAAQADIIALKLQTIVNEANGLGFPAMDGGISQQVYDWVPIYGGPNRVDDSRPDPSSQKAPHESDPFYPEPTTTPYESPRQRSFNRPAPLDFPKPAQDPKVS